MNDDWREEEKDNVEDQGDPALRSVLREWKAPEVPASLDARVLDSYRRKVNREPFWRRFFTASVRVPLPLAVAVMMLFAVALALALSRPGVQSAVPAQYVQAPADQPIVARTSLAGFEPMEEVNVSVVTEQVK